MDKHDKHCIVDESTRSCIQHLNILVGKLQKPHINYLYDCELIPSAPNSNGIAYAIDDAVRSVRIKRDSVCLLLSDAAKCVVAADDTQISVS